jgi:hypothetical protein
MRSNISPRERPCRNLPSGFNLFRLIDQAPNLGHCTRSQSIQGAHDLIYHNVLWFQQSVRSNCHPARSTVTGQRLFELWELVPDPCQAAQKVRVREIVQGTESWRDRVPAHLIRRCCLQSGKHVPVRRTYLDTNHGADELPSAPT